MTKSYDDYERVSVSLLCWVGSFSLLSAWLNFIVPLLVLIWIAHLHHTHFAYTKLHVLFQDYQSHLGRIRSFLAASTRSPSAIQECQRLLVQARQCATAMQAMAQVEGNAFRTQEAQNLVSRDLVPLEQEINKRSGGGGQQEDLQREELFYRPPTQEQLSTQSLIESSNDLLLESQA